MESVGRLDLRVSQKDPKHSLRLITVIHILVELYRVFTGSLLLLAVQSRCDGVPCTPIQDIQRGTTPYLVGVSINLLTLAHFAVLYIAEIMRDTYLIKFLEETRYKPNDSESVGKELLRLRPENMKTLLKFNQFYKQAAFWALVMYSINFIAAVVIVCMYYLDNKTPIAVLTNSLFIGGKLYDVFTIVYTEKNIFFSAYVSKHVQYNDVNPEECAPAIEDAKT